ncbi:hypothetical protein BJ875DRAFT_438493 [Amylocarpus encephaloides]|uniref:Zn(2)-C6 fungal-type domain-containing protein n=1 Tax=Amylocarpus encephaloides TaxID=45428 RepID=A0A9P8C9P1_9HELO|nr:hypothetical protein BJ875DRAFT_438493 [Amylocarpus encephaloides]
MGDRTESATEVKVRKTRASKPKVKTGCQTCKIRRVKCDETKPACLRCVKFGHQCDGYVNKTPSKPVQGSLTSGSRVLVPRSSRGPSPGSSDVGAMGHRYGRSSNDGYSGSSPKLSPYIPGRGGGESTTSSPRVQAIEIAQRPSVPQLYPAPSPRHSPHSIPDQYDHHAVRYQSGPRQVSHIECQNPGAFENFCTATVPPTSKHYSVSQKEWMDVVGQACDDSEDISKAVAVLGGIAQDTRGRNGWSGVGTLSHFKDWRDTDGCLKASKGWRDRSVGTGRGNSMIVCQSGEDENSLPSWRVQEEEETGALGRDVVVGLRCLREWAYKQQSSSNHRCGVTGDLAKSLETRTMLYALQVSCDLQERDRIRREDEGSGEEMEL